MVELPPFPDIRGMGWLIFTFIVYVFFAFLRTRASGSLWLQPLLWTAGLIMLTLVFMNIPLSNYMRGGDWLVLALAPATVVIAVPIYENLYIIRDALWSFMVAMIMGSFVAVVSAVGFGYILGLEQSYLLALTTKSITSPIAMGVASEIGALPNLAMAIVIITGNIGVILSPWLFYRLKLTDPRAQGLALGVGAHGIGTAEAMRQSSLIGSFAGLSMGMNGVLTALVLSFILS